MACCDYDGQDFGSGCKQMSATDLQAGDTVTSRFTGEKVTLGSFGGKTKPKKTESAQDKLFQC